MCLHGCVGPDCHKVWGPQDVQDVCDVCGVTRYDDEGNAREFVTHFPLKERFESDLRCQQYYDSVMWESKRQRVNRDYVTGIKNNNNLSGNTKKNTF